LSSPPTEQAAGLRKSPQQRKVQQRAIDTRAKILEAASREFAAKGFEGASTRGIAEAAGVRQSLLVYHFQTKETLWLETIHMLNAAFVAKFKQRIKGLEGVDAVTKLRLVMEDLIRYGAGKPEAYKFLYQIATVPRDMREKVVEQQLRKAFTGMSRLIVEAQEQGKFVQGDPLHLQYLFHGASTWVFSVANESKLILNRDVYEQAFVDQHVDACLKLFFID
jgi:AcrR family transcriptional regulator